MLQGANTDLFDPLVPKAHNSECQNLLLPSQIDTVKVGSSQLMQFADLYLEQKNGRLAIPL